jgi:hypothetical protein
MMLRISPNPETPSAGSTIITPSGADFLINSSFNMFVDLSLDGGTTWMPSSAPGDMELHIDPANPPTILTQAAYQNNAASFDIPTQPGLLYTVQFSTSLPSPNWTVLRSLSGNGTTIVVTDPNGNQPQRFYRVVIQEDPNQSRVGVGERTREAARWRHRAAFFCGRAGNRPGPGFVSRQARPRAGCSVETCEHA